MDVLGEQTVTVPSALVLVQEDSDGAVRRYSRKYITDAGEFPFLASELITKFDRKRAEHLSSGVSSYGSPDRVRPLPNGHQLFAFQRRGTSQLR